MPPNIEQPLQLPAEQKQVLNVIVVGFGMTAVSFIDKLVTYDHEKVYQIQVFSKENIVAYNRVGLTQYFGHRKLENQWMQPPEWYEERNVQLHLGESVDQIDTALKKVHTSNFGWVSYDKCVLATGSNAALPPGVPINEMDGIFVYRTIDDLDRMIAWADQPFVKRAAVVGGGLLGLEAARAAKDLGIPHVTIYEKSNRLMARQLDTEASATLVNEIHNMGLKTCIGNCPVNLHGITTAANVNQPTAELPKPHVATMTLDDDRVVEADMVIYSIGIVPNDLLAKLPSSTLDRGARGGFKVNAYMETSAPDVYAIGECASFNDMCYGLVAPCYDMADIVAKNLSLASQADRVKFKGADMSTKLKLLGVQVASFGDCFADEENQESFQPLVYRDPFAGIYKKLIFTKDGKKIVGGILVGDSSDYGKLLSLVKNGLRLKTPPSELILGVQKNEAQGADSLPDDTQICSCNNVTKADIRQVIRQQQCENVNQVKCHSKAGTGCGGCLQQVQEVFEAELKSLGQTVSNSLCRHFKYSRAELFTIGQAKNLKTFDDFVKEASVLVQPRDGDPKIRLDIEDDAVAIGCEICKPTIASILASLWNDHILEDGLQSLQDTNDRYLANIQRGGLYSVVPRIAAGEISPEKLKVIAEVAIQHNLYTKITGAQRIDMMGAQKEELPNIWEKLVDAGFESGHAYGKSLRAVKSCVGTSWCRYGQQDSVGFAIMLENRYKGIRSPHKLKGGVSGCIRECAEARGKDFGCIATDKGYNVYVCGNGGSTPKHAELLVADAPEDMVIKYLDRFLMYYIMTADRLMRTARWLEKLDGGMEYLRKVVLEDHLGIAETLETQMHQLILAYQCEWTTVVKDPKRRAHFQSFANIPGKPPVMIEMIEERGQTRPVNWPKTLPPMEPLPQEEELLTQGSLSWLAVGTVDQFPVESGKTVLIGDVQIAVFRTQGKWYATQNMCPHKRALVLSSGLLGTDVGQSPYVSCPMHKKNFDLASGHVLSDQESYQLSTFEVKVEHNLVHLLVPPMEVLNNTLGSANTVINKSMTPQIKPMASGCSAGGSCGDKSLDW
ncbi:hypothetical protein DM01DRAFT_1328556 [Hesseltinella vesiculosa]|uniref:Rieske domain-containing protein n=1 Tax=Hesseltinella vesiculosa TaxID=101127 RepID=A0A1X2G513_9FUNG|nr:hypothetical protein DM01DRAFT_1328556 [Hesseltinella vesiculosa]